MSGRRRHLVEAGASAQVGALLDLENVLYDQRRIDGPAVRQGFRELLATLRGIGQLRYGVGVCDRWLAGMLAPVCARTGVRLHPAPLGRNSADRELLRRAADVPSSISVFVVASGDDAFAPLLARQRRGGRTTVVVARGRSLAASLRRSADVVVDLDGGNLLIDLEAAGALDGTLELAPVA